MIDIAKFSVSARSRFPDRRRDYDTKTHHYTHRYIHPTYVLSMDAFPGKTKVTSTVVKGPRGKILGTVEVDKLDIPDDAVAYDWTVTSRDGGFKKHVSTPIRRAKLHGVESAFGTPYKLSVQVPKPAEYNVRLQVKMASGGGPVHDEKFDLRDFLIVSIGDSYASGEGNPDLPGKPKGFNPDSSTGWWDYVPFGTLIYEGYELVKAATEWGWNKLKQNAVFAEVVDTTVDMDPAPEWLEEKAHRSLMAGPAVAARLLEDVQTGDLISFVSYARSGAEIDDGLFGPRTHKVNGEKRSLDGWIGDVGEMMELKQLSEQLGDRPIDALLISIGGNDVGFSGQLRYLVEGDSVWKSWLGIGVSGPDRRRKATDEIDSALKRLSGADGKTGSLDKLADALDKLNVRQVYITEYPTALFDRIVDGHAQAEEGCEIFSLDSGTTISKTDSELIKASAERLNALLKEKANEHGWIYVGGVADGFAGHGYCMDRGVNGRYYVRASESLVIQGDTDGTMHPNVFGHHVYAESIVTAIRAHRRAVPIHLSGELGVLQSATPLTTRSVVTN